MTPVGPPGVYSLGEGSITAVHRCAAVGSAGNECSRVRETVLNTGVGLVLSDQEFVAVQTVTKSLTLLPIASQRGRGWNGGGPTRRSLRHSA